MWPNIQCLTPELFKLLRYNSSMSKKCSCGTVKSVPSFAWLYCRRVLFTSEGMAQRNVLNSVFSLELSQNQLLFSNTSNFLHIWNHLSVVFFFILIGISSSTKIADMAFLV